MEYILPCATGPPEKTKEKKKKKAQEPGKRGRRPATKNAREAGVEGREDHETQGTLDGNAAAAPRRDETSAGAGRAGKN